MFKVNNKDTRTTPFTLKIVHFFESIRKALFSLAFLLSYFCSFFLKLFTIFSKTFEQKRIRLMCMRKEVSCCQKRQIVAIANICRRTVTICRLLINMFPRWMMIETLLKLFHYKNVLHLPERKIPGFYRGIFRTLTNIYGGAFCEKS